MDSALLSLEQQATSFTLACRPHQYELAGLAAFCWMKAGTTMRLPQMRKTARPAACLIRTTLHLTVRRTTRPFRLFNSSPAYRAFPHLCLETSLRSVSIRLYTNDGPTHSSRLLLSALWACAVVNISIITIFPASRKDGSFGVGSGQKAA